MRLCRFVKDPALWAVLAGMAAESKDLNTAEVAYAAIDEVNICKYVCTRRHTYMYSGTCHRDHLS